MQVERWSDEDGEVGKAMEIDGAEKKTRKEGEKKVKKEV